MSNEIKIQPPSVRSLFISIFFNEIELATGTAFLVENNDKLYLFTARHNVTGVNNATGIALHKEGSIPNKMIIYHHIKGMFGRWLPYVQPLYKDMDGFQDPLWVEHPAFKEKVDFVAFTVENLDMFEFYPYTINNDVKAKPLPADPLSIIGFPFGKTAGGKFAIWSTGFVATDVGLDHDDLPMFLIDCRARKGQSGSPVILYRYGIIHTEEGLKAFDGIVSVLFGIYSGRINSESDLGMVWKESAMLELIKSIPE